MQLLQNSYVQKCISAKDIYRPFNISFVILKFFVCSFVFCIFLFLFLVLNIPVCTCFFCCKCLLMSSSSSVLLISDQTRTFYSLDEKEKKVHIKAITRVYLWLGHTYVRTYANCRTLILLFSNIMKEKF